MPKENYSHIVEVLDRSGSMSIIKTDAIGGHNEFIKTQQKEPGFATYTLAQFDDEYELLQDFVDIKDAKILDEKSYIPRGWTRLLDAIGKTIIAVGEKLSNLKEEERPNTVIFVVYTDGQENLSSEFSKEKILEMIKEQEEKYSWKFIYLSSDLNAFDDAKSYGFSKGRTMNMGKSGDATREVYATVSCLVSQYRSGNLGASFTDEDRQKTK